MSCKSLIQCKLTNASVGPNGQIPFGVITRRFGPSINLNGPGITCGDVGYYTVNCSITLTPETAGIYGVQLYADQALIADASGTATANSPLPIPIVGTARQKCCGATSLSLMLVTPDGVTTNTNVSMDSNVEKC